MSKKTNEARKLNVVQAGRGLWLVKVPNYLSESWERAGIKQPLGVLKVARFVAQQR